MTDLPHPAGPVRRRRAARRRRAEDRRALRSEFELDRPRGLAALRALAANVGELERERIRSHAEAAQRPVTRAATSTVRARATSR